MLDQTKIEIIYDLPSFLALAAKKKYFPSLKLVLISSNITHEDLETIVNTLNSLVIHHLLLDLSFNSIGDRGVEIVIKLLTNKDRPRKIKLNFSGNSLTSKTITHIINALSYFNSSPQQELQLNLSANHIGNDGSAKLAEALKSQQVPPHVEFNLRYNTINLVGANAILAAIKDNSPLGLKILIEDAVAPLNGFATASILSGNALQPLNPNETPTIQFQLNELIRQNEVKQATLACFILQQGSKQNHSSVYGLPDHILKNIYDLIFPSHYKNNNQSIALEKFNQNLSKLFTKFKINSKEDELIEPAANSFLKKLS